MRKQDKAIIWPAYFDQTKTRKDWKKGSEEYGGSEPED